MIDSNPIRSTAPGPTIMRRTGFIAVRRIFRGPRRSRFRERWRTGRRSRLARRTSWSGATVRSASRRCSPGCGPTCSSRATGALSSAQGSTRGRSPGTSAGKSCPLPICTRCRRTLPSPRWGRLSPRPGERRYAAYPVVNEAFAFDYQLNGHRLMVRIDLDQPWAAIPRVFRF